MDTIHEPSIRMYRSILDDMKNCCDTVKGIFILSFL